MQVLVARCPVCGQASEGAICERCNTVIDWEEAMCPLCGRMYSGSLAVCDNCETWLKSEDDENPEIKSLTTIGGLSPETARLLHEQGLHEFSDLVRLALPQSAVRMGLHKTIARRMMMSEFVKSSGTDEEGSCPICHGAFDPTTGVCTKCHYTPLPSWSEQWIEERLQKVAGEVENLCSDPDFLSMSESVRSQLLAEINGMFEEVEDEGKLVEELEVVFGSEVKEDGRLKQYRAQIEAWRNKGFDVSALEELLSKDAEEFRKNCVRIIRRQVQKAHSVSQFACPLCDAFVEGEAKECPNCGAKFA